MRVFAIGDIHGCLAAFDTLLDWVKPTREDVIVTLGDYVDRGPDSRGVIDRLLELREKLNLICLRGNHEKMMLDAYRGGRAEKKMWLSVGGLEALASYGITAGSAGSLDDVPREHWDFLETGLVDYHESNRYIFVHASVLGGFDMPDQPEYALLWEYFPDAMRHHSGKMVVCGHSSQRSGLPKVIPGAVCIDTRAFADGWLTCLDVNEARYWQADQRGNKREGRLDYEE
ncbi:MAG: serine/threonine protein phosphatase [Planctomycetaceae bacterium]|nr:serine/threonine protein phosphatase [Planctomycetaceae bacterium]